MAFLSILTATLVLLLLAFQHKTHSHPNHSEAPPFICRKRVLDFGSKRHLYYDGQSVPIIIETSERPSHQLASHILHIILTEVMGYADVRVVPGYNTVNTTVILNRLAGCPNTGCTSYDDNQRGIPDTMVNIELWSEAGFNTKPWVGAGLVSHLGPLGPVGRFGWFVPTATVQTMWERKQVIVDHWRAFQKDIVTELFSLSEDREKLMDLMTKDAVAINETISDCAAGTLSACSDVWTGCENKPGSHNCALLLTSFPELDMGLLQNQIESLGLNVSVVWLRSHLSHFVQERTEHGLASLFFSWTPNTLTLINNFTRVALPLCQKSHQLPTNCDFEVNQMSKAVWSVIESHAPEAYHVIRNMKFSQDQYEDLLRMYVENNPDFTIHPKVESLQTTACQWISENLNLWAPWLPPNLMSKRKIYLGAMFPITGPFWRLPGVVPGAVLAQEHVNQDERFLSDYEISLVIKDTECKTDIAMKEFMHLMVNETHPIVGILGPGCTDVAENVAGISKHFNRIVVSYSAEALQLADRDAFPLFFRTVPPITQNGVVLVGLFERFGWSQVALLAEVGEFPPYHHFLQDHFQSSGIEVVLQRNIPRQATVLDANKYLDELASTGAKIVILTSFEVSGRAVICQAYKKGMTSHQGYVWFLPHWFTTDWWHTDLFNAQFAEKIPCTTAEMLTALDGYFTISSAVYGDPNSTTVANSTVSHWKQQYGETLQKWHLQDYQSPYASYAYDAVWVFALALDQLLKDDPSALETITTDQTTSRLMYHMNRTQFQGVSGPVQFSGADRTGIINIHQHQHNTSTLVGKYHPSLQSVSVDIAAIVWATGQVPSDGKIVASESPCPLEKFRDLLGVSCDMAIVVANILAFGSFTLCLLLIILIIKFRYDKKVAATRERMEELGLMQDSNILSLDEWELPRENVVLNRKLGEGAFGTVYGGEAHIEDVWCAVAIKTLKVGSSPEEKVDFLCEAEMMKRFNHTNIVKLLGVCTRGEPAYTIMEFMLYGDLKTFLLDRRHLAGKDDREAHDVSTIMLTKYALDVAHGLSYLTSMKYVHRDLACRNCLVHASKTVKISDFGMARHTYDTDYYRFNRKGMLPVRWMAPESLTDGIFTSSSDIWSYGIVLYEIMTLGRFPYQGMSNRQVLELVRDGHTIGLPRCTSQHLKDLIQACWSFDAHHRPHITSIVRTLTNSPPLIEPCLEAPLLPPIDEVREYEELQKFNVHLRKQSNSTSSRLKQISSLDRLPMKKSQSQNSLVSGSLLYWVGDFLRRDGKKRKLSSPIGDKQEVTEPLTQDVVLPKSTSCVASANQVEYTNERIEMRPLGKGRSISLVDCCNGEDTNHQVNRHHATETLLPER